MYAAAFKPSNRFLKEISRRIGTLLWVGRKKMQTRILINRCILKQTKLRVGNTAPRNDLYVNLDAFSGMCHLFIWLWLILFLRFGFGEHSHSPHDTEQAFRESLVIAFSQPVSQFNHAKLWIPATHIPDEFQLFFRMLIGMAVWTVRVIRERRKSPVVPGFPEVNVRPASVVFSTGAADTKLLCVAN